MHRVMQIAIVAGLVAIIGGCNKDTTGQAPWTAGIDADGTTSSDTSVEEDAESTRDSGLDAATDDGGATPDFTDPVISGGSAHTCAVRRSGEIKCWGSEEWGELGDGGARNTHTVTPVRVEGISTATHVSAGWAHTCSVLKSGEVRCWGSGRSGRLGPNRSTSTTPVEVGELPRRAIEVVAGEFHSCALMEGGEVFCWDDLEVAGLAPASDLTAGARHNCAVVDGGEVRCWGLNHSSQLGNPDEDSSSSRVPVEVEGITSARELAGGSRHTCALLKPGEIRCWGEGECGQLGHGTLSGSATPVEVREVGSAVDVASGANHSCALLETGEIRCWGNGAYGQLGNGKKGGHETTKTEDDYRSATPVEVEEITSAVDVAAGLRFSCALLESGEARCWGDSVVHGNRPNSAVPVDVKFE